MCKTCSKLEFKNGIEILELMVARNAAMKTRVDGKFIRASEKTLIRKLKRLWKIQSDWIISTMPQLKFFQNQENNAVEDNVDPQVEIAEMMARMPQKKAVADTIVASMGATMLKAGNTTIKDLDLSEFGISFSLSNPNARSFLKTKLSHELSLFRGNINATTVKGISKILFDSAELGRSIGETSQLIQDQAEHGVFSPARGELIAQTELGRAYGEGQEIPILDFQTKFPERETQKRWRTAGDSKVRASHRENAADGWIPVSQNHSGTGERRAPSDQFGCRCVEEYRILPPE